jgi:4-diphosphocytidyl-2-C-methyl-D-erythritol kinase
MSAETRRARVPAFAKVNLCLEILERRPDGFHNLRTIFQTISLADRLEIVFTPGRETGISLQSSVDIPDNLVIRAAKSVIEATNTKGWVRFALSKRIPMGGGLGGGSSDAAAVLLALPVLTGRPLSWERLVEIAAELGSDVPFFLLGGAALGLGRGTEIYPLAITGRTRGLLVTPGLHVSTADAFRALGRSLTWDSPSPKINVSQRVALAIGGERVAGDWSDFCSNDFESVVFRQHPQLSAIKRKLKRLGANPALMTGSGSAVFGIFDSPEKLARAKVSFRNQRVFPISFVSRARYVASWWKQLSEHMQGNQWPPQSRYSR